MDDRTTTHYHAEHLEYFRSLPRSARASEARDNEPDEPFEIGAVRAGLAASSGIQPAARTGRQLVQRVPLNETLHASTLAGVAPPRKAAERTLSLGWHMAPPSPSLTAALTPPILELTDLDDDPFTSPSAGAAFWVSCVAAAVGLFGAVLLGQILLHASSEQLPAARESLAPAAVRAPAPAPQPSAAAAVGGDASAPERAIAEPARAATRRTGEDIENESRARARRMRDSDDAEPSARARRTRKGDDAEPGAQSRRTRERDDVEPVAHAGRTRERDDARARDDAEPSARAGRTRDNDDAEPSAQSRRTRERDDAEPGAQSRRTRKGDDVEPGAQSHRTRKGDDVERSGGVASSGAPATLRLNTRPWSQVTLDGQLVGHTPLMNLRVAPGTHTLRLVNPAFGLSKSVMLKVAPGETVTRVELLEP